MSCSCPNPRLCEILGTHIVGRMWEIWIGISGLSREKENAYRLKIAKTEKTLQESLIVQPVNTTAPAYRQALPQRPKPFGTGHYLTKSLAWIEKIKPEKATCSCKTLASEMDADGVAKCRQRRDEYYLPKMLENKTAIVEAMRAEGGLLGVAGFVGGLIPDAVALPWLRAKFDAACDAAEAKNKPRQRAIRQRGGFASAFRKTGTPEFVTSAQLQEDIKQLVSKLPENITAVAGVARSGLAVATMISMYLHLPMLTIRQTMNDVVPTGNGWRLGGTKHVNPKTQHVVVIDDTVMTGNSLRTIEPLLQQQFGEITTAAVYVNPLALKKPDVYTRELGWPHLLEWNLFNSVLSPNMACDFDGILCRDCPPGSDDDGIKYLEFIRNAKPLYLPRKTPIPLIVTARVEKYRSETMAWLSRHGVTCNQLIMHQANSTRERERDNIAAFKARHFSAWAAKHKPTPPPLGFIESDDRQAREIARISRLLTICPATGKVY